MCKQVQEQEEGLHKLCQEVHRREEGHRGRVGAAEEALLSYQGHCSYPDPSNWLWPKEGPHG